MKKKKFRFFIINPTIIKIWKKLSMFILVLFLLYLIFGILLFLNTDRFLYHPTNEDFYECDDFMNFTKENFNGTRFFYKKVNQTSPIIIYYHGNGGTACDRSYLAESFDNYKYNLIFVEYSGFANDDNDPSKELILNDVKNIQKFVEKENISKIVTIGESLGTAFASYQSTLSEDIYSVILVAPFDSNKEVAKNTYLRYYPLELYQFDNYDLTEYLEDYSRKLTIIHGTHDENIPIVHARNLYNSSLKSSKEMFEIQNATHKNLYSNYRTFMAIDFGIRE